VLFSFVAAPSGCERKYKVQNTKLKAPRSENQWQLEIGK
jgi:hypothetical protein